MNIRGGALGVISTIFTSVLLPPLSVCLCHETGGNDAKSFKANNFEKICQKVSCDQGFDKGGDAGPLPEAPAAHHSRVGFEL